MDTTKDAIFRALRGVNYPGYSRDIVSFGLVHGVLMEGTTARVGLVTGHLDEDVQQEIAREAAKAVLAVPGVEEVTLQIGHPPRSQQKRRQPSEPQSAPDVAHVVAVASGKGGVGKSTVAVNLAVALAAAGLRVGLLDADIHGPNVARMLGVDRLPPGRNGKVLPATAHGVKVISLAFAGPDQGAAIWRGPMIDKAIQQFFFDVEWGQLDLLVVDLPPGTGDAQLSLVQRVPLDGAIIVSTPQEVALDDAHKALSMFQKLEVPVLGLIENMSYFRCPDCGEHHYIFGFGGVRRAADDWDLPLLAEAPLETEVRAGGDRGLPAALMPNSVVGATLRGAATTIARRLGISKPEPKPLALAEEM